MKATQYVCEQCRLVYATAADATACEATHSLLANASDIDLSRIDGFHAAREACQKFRLFVGGEGPYSRVEMVGVFYAGPRTPKSITAYHAETGVRAYLPISMLRSLGNTDMPELAIARYWPALPKMYDAIERARKSNEPNAPGN